MTNLGQFHLQLSRSNPIRALSFWIVAFLPVLAWAESDVIPEPYSPSRYQTLWTRSPFVASSAIYDPDSAEFELVGLGKVDDDFYASILEKQSGQVFVLANHHPSHGLKLYKVHRGPQPEDSYAILGKDDQMITLHLRSLGTESPSSVAPPAPATLQPLSPAELSPDSLIPHSLAQPSR